MKKLKKISINVLITILIAVVIGFFVLNTIIVSGYTVNQSDDYSHAVKVGQFHIPFLNYFMTSLSFTKRMYFEWAGNYFSMFLQSLLSPLNMGGNTQLRIVMVVNAVLFFVSIIVLLWIFLGKLINAASSVKLLMILMIIYPLMNYRVYYEVFYWFSGATSYSFPLSFVLISLIIIVSHNYSFKGDKTNIKSVASYIIALTLGLLGVGGSLTISGTVCYVMLLYILYLYLEHDKSKLKYIIIAFAVYILGTFANFIAPGNYVRAGRSAGGLGIVSAIKNTLVVLYSEYYWLFRNTNFFLVMLALAIVGVMVNKSIKVNLKNYTIVSILGLLTPLVSIFPVVLGYNSSFVANRTLFVIEQSLMISFANIAFISGVLIAKYVGEHSQKTVAVSLGVIALCFMTLNGYGINNHESLRTAINIMNGTYANYYRECSKLQDYFEGCNGMDVVMTAEDVPVGLENFSNIYLENSWVNEGIAKYYGMNSLTLLEKVDSVD